MQALELMKRFNMDDHLDNDGYRVVWVKDRETGNRAVLYPEIYAHFTEEPDLEHAALFIAEAQFAARTTRHYNGECCCERCDPSYCYDCSHYVNFCRCPRPVSLYKSPLQRRDYANAGEPPF